MCFVDFSLTITCKQVFDITSLQIFNSNELDHLLCGRRELWEVLIHRISTILASYWNLIPTKIKLTETFFFGYNFV